MTRCYQVEDLWEDSADPGPVFRWRRTLLILLLLLIVVVVAWKFIGPGDQFLQESPAS